MKKKLLLLLLNGFLGLQFFLLILEIMNENHSWLWLIPAGLMIIGLNISIYLDTKQFKTKKEEKNE